MVIAKWLPIALLIVFTGCAEPERYKRDTSPFDSPLFVNYETYQATLKELDDIDSMSDDELDDFLFSDDYKIHPEFLSHIAHYQQLKEDFTSESTIRSNVKLVMADLENIATEVDFIEFKNNRELKGIAGRCTRFILNSRRPLRLIQIDYTFWNLYSPLERKRAIFHELGHCDLDRKDEPNYTPSFMAYKSTTLDLFKTGYLLEDRKQKLYQELFDPEKMYNDENPMFVRYETLYFTNQLSQQSHILSSKSEELSSN